MFFVAVLERLNQPFRRVVVSIRTTICCSGVGSRKSRGILEKFYRRSMQIHGRSLRSAGSFPHHQYFQKTLVILATPDQVRMVGLQGASKDGERSLVERCSLIELALCLQ